MCHQHEHERHFRVTFLGLMSFIKMTHHRIVLPVRSARARENVPCSIAFLTEVIAIPTGINHGASGLNILDWFQNKIRNVDMVCSREQTYVSKFTYGVM